SVPWCHEIPREQQLLCNGSKLSSGRKFKRLFTKKSFKINIKLQGGGCFITDLGLCGPVDEKSSCKIYGIVSYIAPEVLRGKKILTIFVIVIVIFYFFYFYFYFFLF